MRQGYSNIGGRGPSFSSYHLTSDDLGRILAEYFGFNPATVNISGMKIPDGEIQVSGELDLAREIDDEVVSKCSFSGP